MQCIIILPGKNNRLPTAQQLSRAGFRVSTAVAVRENSPAEHVDNCDEAANGRAELAVAAEEHAPYPQPHT